MIREMKVDIMKEIKLVITTAISSQLSEIAKAMESEIKAAITMEVSTHIKESMNMSPIELEEE